MKIEGTQVLTLHKYVQPICEIVSNLHSHMVYHILQLVKRQSLGYALKKVRIITTWWATFWSIILNHSHFDLRNYLKTRRNIL